jgi:antitoxin VapB
MTLTIDDTEAEQAIRELAERTGESINVAVLTAAKDRLNHLRGPEEVAEIRRNMERYRLHWASLPILDHRSADEIVGYDENGAPA